MICPRCKKDIVFIEFKFKHEEHMQRIRENNHLAEALTKDMTLNIIDEWDKRLNNDGRYNCITIYGEQGGGKSITGFDIVSIHMSLLKYNFGIRNVGFSYAETIGNLQKATEENWVRRSVFLTDEQESQYGIGMNRESGQIVSITNIARKWQPNLIYISPDLREHNHHYIFEVFDQGVEEIAEKDINEKNRHRVMVINGKKMIRTHTRCLVSGANGIYVGFFISEYPKLPSEFFDEYDKKKDEFIANLLGMKGSPRYEQKMKVVHKAADSETWDKLKNQMRKKLFLKNINSGYTEGEYKEMVEMVEMERFKRKFGADV